MSSPKPSASVRLLAVVSTIALIGFACGGTAVDGAEPEDGAGGAFPGTGGGPGRPPPPGVGGGPTKPPPPSECTDSSSDVNRCRSNWVDYAACAGQCPCLCDRCVCEIEACESDRGCLDIVECQRATGCRGVACYLPAACMSVIDAHGGPFGPAASLSVALQDCADLAGCPSTCQPEACPEPVFPVRAITDACCRDEDSCGFSVSLLGPLCHEPNQAGEIDLDCPDQDLLGFIVPGCCRPNGTCGNLDELFGLGCADPEIFGAASPVDCEGRPVSSCTPTGLCTRSINDCGVTTITLPECLSFYDPGTTTCADIAGYLTCSCQCLPEASCTDYFVCGEDCFSQHC